MVDSGGLSIFDALEREIKEEIRNWPPFREPQPVDFAPPAIRGPLLSMSECGEPRKNRCGQHPRLLGGVTRRYENRDVRLEEGLLAKLRAGPALGRVLGHGRPLPHRAVHRVRRRRRDNDGSHLQT